MAVDEPLSLAQCPACSTPVYRWRVGGLEYTADLTVVDAQQAAAAVQSGRRLYRLLYAGGRPMSARPADMLVITKLVTAPPEERPAVIPAHPCTAVTRPLPAPQPAAGPGAPADPPVPPAGRTTPSRGPQAVSSGATGADRLRSDRRRPSCNRCSRPMADGTYASIEVGDLLVWAEHLTDCTA